MIKKFLLLALFTVLSLTAFSQAPFKIEISAGDETFTTGGNITLPCSQDATIRVFSSDSLSARIFCVSEVISSHGSTASGVLIEGRLQIKGAEIVGGVCSFRFPFSKMGSGSYTFRVYEMIGDQEQHVRGHNRQRFVGVDCQ